MNDRLRAAPSTRAVPLLQLSMPMARIHRAIPCLPEALRSQPTASERLVKHLVQELVGPTGRLGAEFRAPIQWFYTPLPAATMLGAFDEIAVVYDCMDELSQFAFAPGELVSRGLGLEKKDCAAVFNVIAKLSGVQP